MQLIWTANLKVGIKHFDADHKQVLRMLNELNCAIQESAVSGKVEPIEMEIALHRLENYIRYHCAQEELCMALAGYPDLEQHKREHAKLGALIGDMQKRFKGSTNPKDAAEIERFVHEWIIDHIFVVDKRYTEHLHSKGIF
ncbi:MAG: bacteriohemerythrin [Terracidiphilus sp.]